MKSIKENVKNELIISKSRFICFLYPVSSVIEVDTILTTLRNTYPDANHHCYAYVIGQNQEIQKYSDDGEPSKTAGMPMIEVLKKQDLTNTLAVTIRYFGGIKLGAGGLVRAYTKSVSESCKLVVFTSLVTYVQMNIFIPFDQIGNVEKHLRDNEYLTDTVYTSEVIYKVQIQESVLDTLQNYITESTKGIGRFEIQETFQKYE